MRKSFFGTAWCFMLAAMLAACGDGREDESDHGHLSSSASCNTEQLNICLVNGGGQACYEKWHCSAGDDNLVSLPVPYYYQLNNANQPYRSCNITSVAMALSYKTKSIRPDTIYQKYGLVFTGTEMASIARSYGAAKSVYHAGGVGISKIKSYLDKGVPVIFQGQFTSSGHIILIVGYDSTGWIVNDPYGEWYSWGYDNQSTVGNHVHYSYDLVDRNSLGGRGNYHITAVY